MTLLYANKMGLLREEVIYESKVNPRTRLATCGATEAEQELLVSGGGPKHWKGERIELNAMTSPQFVDFVERKLRWRQF